MEYFQEETHRLSRKCNNKKARLTEEQVSLLETSFNLNTKLDRDRKVHLANKLGVPPRRVAIWYQNKRARWKSQSLELDYKALQLKLRNALEDKKRLEREVGRLKEELNRAHEMVLSTSNNAGAYTSFSSFSASCCDEDAEDSKRYMETELYECLTDDRYGQFDHGR